MKPMNWAWKTRHFPPHASSCFHMLPHVCQCCRFSENVVCQNKAAIIIFPTKFAIIISGWWFQHVSTPLTNITYGNIKNVPNHQLNLLDFIGTDRQIHYWDTASNMAELMFSHRMASFLSCANVILWKRMVTNWHLFDIFDDEMPCSVKSSLPTFVNNIPWHSVQQSYLPLNCHYQSHRLRRWPHRLREATQG